MISNARWWTTVINWYITLWSSKSQWSAILTFIAINKILAIAILTRLRCTFININLTVITGKTSETITSKRCSFIIIFAIECPWYVTCASWTIVYFNFTIRARVFRWTLTLIAARCVDTCSVIFADWWKGICCAFVDIFVACLFICPSRIALKSFFLVYCYLKGLRIFFY